jgi:hypothetical protein
MSVRHERQTRGKSPRWQSLLSCGRTDSSGLSGSSECVTIEQWRISRTPHRRYGTPAQLVLLHRFPEILATRCAWRRSDTLAPGPHQYRLPLLMLVGGPERLAAVWKDRLEIASAPAGPRNDTTKMQSEPLLRPKPCRNQPHTRSPDGDTSSQEQLSSAVRSRGYRVRTTCPIGRRPRPSRRTDRR